MGDNVYNTELMSRLIYDLYYAERITEEVAMLLLEQLSKSKEKRRHY